MKERPLSDLEKILIQKLLSIDFPGVETLKEQLATCRAKDTGDNDNYGSIYLVTDSNKKYQGNLRVPVEALVDDLDGQPINILLHVVDGSLNELEIVKLDGTPIKGSLNPAALKVIVNA